MLRPPALKPGDTVGIIATARKITADELKPAVQLLERWGLKVQLGKTIGLEAHQFADTDAGRANGLQEMLDDDNIKTVICARGGYGTVRILDLLRFEKFSKYPKWIVGFSDITALHVHIQQQCRIQTLHALMPFSFVKEQPSEAATVSLKAVLFGEPLSYTVPVHPMNRKGKAEGTLTGGNLSVLYSLMGSVSEPDTAGAILFLEDVDEYLYHIDRMMVALKRAGKLKELAGLIVGAFTGMRDNETPFGKSAEAIIAEHVAEYDYPVCFGFPAGHIPDNRALIMGGKMKLQAGADVNVSFAG